MLSRPRRGFPILLTVRIGSAVVAAMAVGAGAATGVGSCSGPAALPNAADPSAVAAPPTAAASPPRADSPAAASPTAFRIPAEAQRRGDPVAGYRALVERNYIGCGLPLSLYRRLMGSWSPRFLLPDRAPPNDAMPYFLTASTAPSGVEIVTANCLSCHAAFLRGELVVGLGDSSLDFSVNPAPLLRAAGLGLRDPKERAEWAKLASRVDAIGPHILTNRRGANPGDAIAAALFAHRDPSTLAWSDEPLMAEPNHAPAPLDVPPWWRMKKKNAMFYTAAGRGDHARIMMTASALCTDSVEQARAIDRLFPDIRAFILSLEPPRWPFPLDAQLAARGRGVFETHCQRCHGTYGSEASYPNLVVGLEEIGTDPTLARGSGQFAAPYVDWFNRSFYGEIARLEPAQGYIAPPLDGIWATAPFLHNGSVPTLAALLDSASRPSHWQRSYDSSDYDPDAVGWRYTAEARPGSGIDTTAAGYSNAGHTFGDELTAEERRAVLEYLKTL